MAGYTQINQKSIDAILSLYGRNKAIEWHAMMHGISNSNFRVVTADNEELLLKISNDKSRTELEAEQEVLLWLKSQEYPHLVAPLTTISKREVYQLDDYYGVIFPFVEGETPQISPHTCKELGSALAKLHLYQSYHQVRPYSSVGQDYRFITSYMLQSHNHEYFTKQSRFLLDSYDWSAFENSGLPQGFIHGDLYYDNTLFKKGELQYVLDFEQAGIGSLIFDIGISISGSCLDEHKEIDLDLILNFLHGYEHIRPLEPIEKENLFAAIVLGLISISLWRIIRFNQKQITADRQESYKELLDRALAFQKLTSSKASL